MLRKLAAGVHRFPAVVRKLAAEVPGFQVVVPAEQRQPRTTFEDPQLQMVLPSVRASRRKSRTNRTEVARVRYRQEASEGIQMNLSADVQHLTFLTVVRTLLISSWELADRRCRLRTMCADLLLSQAPQNLPDLVRRRLGQVLVWVRQVVLLLIRRRNVPAPVRSHEPEARSLVLTTAPPVVPSVEELVAPERAEVATREAILQSLEQLFGTRVEQTECSLVVALLTVLFRLVRVQLRQVAQAVVHRQRLAALRVRIHLLAELAPRLAMSQFRQV